MSRPLIILFARRPVIGRVKTRVGLEPASAVRLHRAFVRDTLQMLQALEGVDVELTTDDICHEWEEWPGARSVQCSGDLGQRMWTALAHAIGAGREKVMILGSDSPGLPGSHVMELVQSERDVAIGPTEDGGYYAIACRRIHPEMFSGVRWSCEFSLGDTVRAIKACGLTVGIGSGWFDVDTPADLARLKILSRSNERLRGVLLEGASERNAGGRDQHCNSDTE
jgi:uncharacterized protein